MFSTRESRCFHQCDSGAHFGGTLPPADQLSDSVSVKLAREGMAVILPDETYSHFPSWKEAMSEIRGIVPSLPYNPIQHWSLTGVRYARSYLTFPNDWSNPWHDTIARGAGADRLRELFISAEIGTKFAEFYGAPLKLLSCRINRMQNKDFIGYHTHSKGEVNFVLALQEADCGGEYYCTIEDHKNLDDRNRPTRYEVGGKYSPGTLVINEGRPESVNLVSAGERYSVVWLLEPK